MGAGDCVVSDSSRHVNVVVISSPHQENLRFREVSLTFKVAEDVEADVSERMHKTEYPDMSMTLGTFKLNIKAGDFANSELVVMLGQIWG